MAKKHNEEAAPAAVADTTDQMPVEPAAPEPTPETSVEPEAPAPADENFVVTQEDLDANPALVEADIQVGDVGTPAIEPRLRYNGQIVVSDEMRTVGEQTFHHISIGDGSSYDLTEQEYREKVYVAYSPNN